MIVSQQNRVKQVNNTDNVPLVSLTPSELYACTVNGLLNGVFKLAIDSPVSGTLSGVEMISR